MIRTSKHTTKFCNKGKFNKYQKFIEEYKLSVSFYVDYLFDKIDIKNYKSPKFVSTKHNYPQNTPLSQRALKCAATQACGMIKAVTETPRIIIWVINKLKKTNEDSSKLQERIDNWKLTKPKIADNFKCEINSICADYKTGKKFSFIQLKSIGKSYGKIRIPIAQHRQSKKWNKKGEQLNSYLLGKDYVNLRYEIITPEVKTIGETVGADQGKITCLSMSDGQITGKNKDGYDLNVILKILERRKKEVKVLSKDKHTGKII